VNYFTLRNIIIFIETMKDLNSDFRREVSLHPHHLCMGPTTADPQTINRSLLVVVPPVVPASPSSTNVFDFKLSRGERA
jgi:hypothetical protein